jgi:hypothetical protein
MAMTTKDRAIAATAAVLIAAIGIFAGIKYTGGSENHCVSSVCGDKDTRNTVVPQSQVTQ